MEQALLCPCEAVHLLLVDVQLEGLSGLEGIALLKQRWPEAKVLMVSASQDAKLMEQALTLGAMGFICKTESPQRLLAQITEALADLWPDEHLPKAPLKLTPRQYEVLDLLHQGLSNKLIGRRLDLSENTVRGHVQATLSALNVSSRSEAAFVARRLGLVR
ncbi:Transcriptional regulatory protein FixJ [Pseudomonas reidholzensis]|uniref:Transcriptional regulatory protein FixJ n=2 Tax=Pseudomonas reidholzensis TaxID=1785162 RepID=A0A383RNN9_9PSED|nr:Transcriptional regulatory protein FixJ [Pseudomonas reidholzensis]